MSYKTKSKLVYVFLALCGLIYGDLYGLISPIKRDTKNQPSLTNCDDITLVSQKIDFYHHPLGIWYVNCTSKFQNLYPKRVIQEMAFNSGNDITIFDSKLHCDEFFNFMVHVNGKKLTHVKMKEVCENYVERIGMEWTNNDKSGIGFLNTWEVNFEPEETVEVKVQFCFIAKMPPIEFHPDLKESWYIEATDWLKNEYLSHPENNFKFPLNMGSFWTMSIDTLLIRTYYSKNWFLIESEPNRQYDPKNIILYTHSEPIGFFTPPAVELTTIAGEELKDMSPTELKILRNSFFAKYGRIFDAKWLKLYFKKQIWYQENPHYDNWYLTDLDVQNMKRVYQFEQSGKVNE